MGEDTRPDAGEELHSLTEAPTEGPGSTPPPRGRDPESGARETRLGLYELRREIGRGGMGVVYEAWHPVRRALVALKVIRTDTLGEEEEHLRDYFLREAGILTSLEHPNVVACYDANEAMLEGKPALYMALELLSGEPLSERLSRGPLEPVEALRVTAGIARALDALHTHDPVVLHRDVKPANVFLTDDGEIKLLDFGLAALADWRLAHLSVFAAGSRPYMAPEQFDGLRFCTPRSDLYSLGIALYEMLTGRRPFLADTDEGFRKAHRGLSAPPLHRMHPGLAGHPLEVPLRRLLTKLLAKRPEERYASAREVLEAIERIGRGESLTRPRVTRPETERLVRRAALSVGGALVLTLAALGARSLWRSGDRPGPAVQTEDPGEAAAADAEHDWEENPYEPGPEEVRWASRLQATTPAEVSANGAWSFVMDFDFAAAERPKGAPDIAVLDAFLGEREGLAVRAGVGLSFEGSPDRAGLPFLEISYPFRHDNAASSSVVQLKGARGGAIWSFGDALHLGVDLSAKVFLVGTRLTVPAESPSAALPGAASFDIPAEGEESLRVEPIFEVTEDPGPDDAPWYLYLIVDDEEAGSGGVPGGPRRGDPVRLRVWPGAVVENLELYGVVAEDAPERSAAPEAER